MRSCCGLTRRCDSIVKLSDGKAVVDKGSAVWPGTCWPPVPTLLPQRTRHLIPEQGSIAADVYSRELGDVLFSTDGKNVAIVFNFTKARCCTRSK